MTSPLASGNSASWKVPTRSDERSGSLGRARSLSGSATLDPTTRRSPCDTVRAGRKTRVRFGDVVGAEERPAAGGGGRRAREDALVREERHPARAPFDTRFVGRNTAGDAKRQPVFDGLPRREAELVGLHFLPRATLDRKMAPAAAGGERDGKGGECAGQDTVHFSSCGAVAIVVAVRTRADPGRLRGGRRRAARNSANGYKSVAAADGAASAVSVLIQ